MTTADLLGSRLVAVRSVLEAKAAVRDHLAATQRELGARIGELEREILALDVALSLVHQVRDATSERVQSRLAELCSEALRVVFDDPTLTLEIVSAERRGVVEADIYMRRGELSTDPLEGNGGGLVADVAAMLRLVMTRLLVHRGIAPLLILDEPFAALSRGHRGAMAETLEEVAETLGIQVITVTHADEFARGAVYRVQWADRAAMRAEVVREE